MIKTLIKVILPLCVCLSHFTAQAQKSTDSLFSPHLLNTLKSFNAYLTQEGLTNKTCTTTLPKLMQELRGKHPSYFNLTQATKDFDAIMQESFALKINLRDQLKRLSQAPCVNAIREALVIARYVEDYFLTTVLDPKPFDSKTDAKAGPILMAPHQALQTLSRNKVVTLKSGDLLLSRGNAYTSAAIARIGESPAQFSHVSQVFINAPVGTEIPIAQALNDPRVYTVEAHIEVGSFVRSFAKYAQDGNARVAVFRFRGKERAAHEAALSIFNYVTSYQKQSMQVNGRTRYTVNDNPPYDFAMDSYDHREIFCAEIVSMAYDSVGIRIPMFPTQMKQNDLTQTMGIRSRHTFAPADIEVDPNFDLIAEWRDLRKTPSILKKDVALTAMYEWMKKHQYRFHYYPLDYVKAQIAWIARQMDLGFSERLPKNMEKRVVRMTFAIDRVGESLERELDQLEKRFLEGRKKFKPTYTEQMQALEQFRLKDLKAYKEDHRGLFHGFHHTFRK